MTDVSSLVWIAAAFGIYLIFMVLIGAVFFKKTQTTSDYFLGGRGLNSWVAALSAQASDMSGWLLMGLPGALYAAGSGQLWIGVGLAIGTALNWIIVSSRLRKYTIRANNSLTLPQYLENRFHDRSKVLRVASSVFITIFFLVYTASAFSASAKLFSTVFGINYTAALTLGAFIILAYTFLGGFLAVCWTDFFQGMLMLIALLTVPIVAVFALGGVDSTLGIMNSTMPEFLNPLTEIDGRPLGFINILSQLAWGLGYFGMPHILVRFMAIRSEEEVSKSRVIAIIWVALSLTAAVLVGLIGRVYLTTPLEGAETENVFIRMILQMFTVENSLPLIAGILLCGILAAIMSTADSQLLVTASSITEDIMKSFRGGDLGEKKMIQLSRVAVIAVSVVAYFIAMDPNSSIMGLVSNAWSGFGSCFGPLVLLSLFWKRCNTPGAIAGIISGGLFVIFWDYIPVATLADGTAATLGASTGIYSLLIGFFVSLVFIVGVSLATKAPSAEVVAEFDDVQNVK